MSGSVMREFTGTCEPIALLDCDESLFRLDPCDCARYYRCANNRMVEYSCSATTLWDQQAKNCAHDVLIRLRDDCDRPWSRCNITESRSDELEEYCTKTTTEPAPTTTTTATTTIRVTPEPDGGGINVGLAIGLIVAGAVLAVIVIAAIFVYMRNRKKKGIKSKRPTIANNPEYFEGGVETDPYDFINDRDMSDPTYQGEPSGLHSNGTASMTTKSSTIAEPIEYDNSAFRSSTSGNSEYTRTLSLSQRDSEIPYSQYALDSNSNDISVDTHDHRKSVNRPDSGVANVASDSDNDHTNEDRVPVDNVTQDRNNPQYYTLTRGEV